MSEYIERYWRDAKPEDAIKEPPMVARFRNGSGFNWYIDYLTGIRCNHDYPWYSVRLGSHKQCQVYDVPDPGEGWRLIDPNTEPLQEGDEFMVSFDRESGWVEFQVRPNGWSEMCFYRRRIEQPKPEPRYEPFKWENREQLRGRWILNHIDEQEWVIDDLQNINGNLYICGHVAAYFLNWKFVDTGEPVGRRVQ